MAMPIDATVESHGTVVVSIETYRSDSRWRVKQLLTTRHAHAKILEDVWLR